MNRRRWIYPLAALLAAGAVLLADRLLHPPVAKRQLPPPLRYSGPLEMRPAPREASTPPAPAPAPSPARR